jgi:phage-related tail fiber protein
MTTSTQALLDSIANFDARVKAKLDLKLDTSGTAAKATVLETARNLYISGDGTATGTFDGSSSVTLNLALKNSGVVAGQKGDGNTVPVITVNAKGIVTALSSQPIRRTVIPLGNINELPPSGETDTLYLIRIGGATVMYRWTGVSYENMTATLSVATTANMLTTPRQINIVGDIEGSVGFDGSTDVSITTLLLNTGVTAGTYPKVTVDAKGRVTDGAALVAGDIPLLNQNTTGNAGTANSLTTPRSIALQGDATGMVSFDGSSNVQLIVTVADNSHLHTVANITGLDAALAGFASLNSPVFTGTPIAPAPLAGANTTQVATTAFVQSTVSANAPSKTGTGATGTWAIGISGNAATATLAASATKLETPRAIAVSGDATGSVSFDGTGAVSIPMVLANSGVTAGNWPKVTVDAKGRVTAGLSLLAGDIPLLNQNTTGLAATATLAAAATKLATARDITLSGDTTGTVSFDGSASVGIVTTLAASGVVAGTHNNSATAISPITVDSKGRVTAVGTAVTITPAWDNITGKPTSLTGFGIVDGDDVREYLSFANFPVTGAVSKIYVDGTTGKLYRWTGSVYSELSKPVASTTELTEGSNLYFTNARAQAAVTTITGNAATATTATKLATTRAIAVSGDATGTVNFDGTAGVTIPLVLAASGVAADTYNNSATTNTPITVDSKGRVTATGAGVTITPAWGSVTGKPSTIAGYGISDAQLLSQKGAANGYASLDSSGLVPAAQLPSYVDDVLEYVTMSVFPATGETGKIYVDTTTNKTWRWSGTVYVEISASPGSTDSVTEGSINLYFTNARAQAAVTTITGNAATATLAAAATKLATTRAISVSGDATGSVNFDGSAAAAIPLVLANSGVVAGIYNSTTQIVNFTVDAKGRITAVGSAANITPAFASVTGKPTTLAGYGITDALGLSGGALTSNLTGTAFKAAIGIPNAGDSSTNGHSFATDGDTGLFSISAGIGGLFADSTEVLRFGATEVTTNVPITRTTNAGKSRWMSQDGTGRQHWYWNTAGGTLPLLEAAGEGAGDIMFHADASGGEYFKYRAATGVGKAAGSAIVWEDVLHASRSGTFQYLGSDVITVANYATMVPSSGVTAGTYPKVTVDDTGRVTAGTALLAADVPTLNQSTSGNAATATKLATTRAISVSGDATGTVNFDGSAAAAIPLTLAASGVVAGTANNSATANTPLTIDAKGRVTAIGAAVTITPAFASITGKPTTLAGYGITDGGSSGANYQSTSRVSFLNVGSAQAISVGNLLCSDTYSDASLVPVNGIYAKGAITSAGVITGNGSGLTTLNATNLTSGTLPDGRLTGTYTGVNITGNAATATTLQTARTINGVSFNGGANITVADGTKMPLAGGAFTGFVGTAAINGVMAVSDTSASFEVRNIPSASGDGGLAMMAFHAQAAYAIKMGLRADGYFGIGGWSRAAWSWYTDPSGNMVTAGNVSAYSDPRLKENFKRVEKPLDILSKLDGGTFDWKHGFAHTEAKAGKHDYGILADQVEAVMPEIVTTSIEIEGESYRTVDYSKIVPVLIESTKELHAMILELKAEIAELRQSV